MTRDELYLALVGHRVDVAREAGLGLMSVHARAATSGPLLERLGFVELLSYPTFTLPP